MTQRSSKTSSIVNKQRELRAVSQPKGRCFYCRGIVQKGEHREFQYRGVLRYTHKRHNVTEIERAANGSA